MAGKRLATVVVIGALALTLSGAAAWGAQQAAAPDPENTLAALTAEVRLLRIAVEKSGQTQAQIQALGIYLSAQQSRLVQLAARADSLQRERDGQADQARRLSGDVTELEKLLLLPLTTPGGPSREDLQQQLTTVKRELASMTAMEAQAGARHSQASAELQTELGRWNDLIARLEQLTRP